MAEDNASETPAVTPKPRAPRKRTPATPKDVPAVENASAEVVKPAPKPRKPRKTAAQKAQEAEEAERLKAEAEASATPELSSPVEEPAVPRPPVAAPPVAPPVVEEKVPEAPEEKVLSEEDIPKAENNTSPETFENSHGGVEELQALFAEADEEPEPEPVVPPLSVRGVILAPGYWQGFEGPHGRLNVFSFMGVIFAFTFFPLGFIFSLLGLMNARPVPSDKIGRALGWIGLVVSGVAAFITVLWLLFLPLSLAFGGPMGHHLY